MAKRIAATVTSKGQVTVPVSVRRHLGLEPGSSVTFVVEDDGTVHLDAPRFPEVRSLAGVAGSLKKPLPWKQVLATAYEDRFADAEHG